MSIGVFLLSLFFAGVQTGVCVLLQAFAEAFGNLPLWLISGGTFALGMLLSFLLILIVGGAGITRRAADFVRDHLGRALALMLASVVLIFALGSGAEAVYHLERISFGSGPRTEAAPASGADVCYLLDCSSSMMGSGIESLHRAFQDAVTTVDDGRRISVVFYESDASVGYDWHALDAATRAEVIGLVNDAGPSGGTDFNEALAAAEQLAVQAASEGRSVSVIMISDGQDGDFVSVQSCAPELIARQVPVYTVGVGDAYPQTLKDIAAETGGAYSEGGVTAESFSAALTEATVSAVGGDPAASAKRDTLLSPRYARTTAIINPMILRIVLLFIVGFAFKLIVSICMGSNFRSFGSHLLLAFVIALAGAAAVEFGYQLSATLSGGLKLAAGIAAPGLYWVLMMCQMVRTKE